MDSFRYRDGHLFCEDVRLDRLAECVGTPFYVYSRATLEDHLEHFTRAFSELNPLVCFSIKTCNNINLIKLLVDGGAGIDVVSGGELFRAQAGGVDVKKVVFAGVGKTAAEIRQALEAGVGWLNVESQQEFQRISSIAAELGCSPKVALRVNPHVYDEKTHAKMATGKKSSKFGVEIDSARQFFEEYGRDPNVQLRGIHIHLGSPIFSSRPYVLAIEKVLLLIDDLRQAGFEIEMLDIGGGYLSYYESDEESQTWEDYAADIVPMLRNFAQGGQIILEPGRTISANAGALIARVQYTKSSGDRQFAIVDTGMGHLIRPTLYDAFHFIWPTSVQAEHVPTHRGPSTGLPGLETYDVVGPICESGDYLAQGRSLPPIEPGNLLCVFAAGAYGMVMASQYNAIPRPVEVLVDGAEATIIRHREQYSDFIELERRMEPIDLNR